MREKESVNFDGHRKQADMWQRWVKEIRFTGALVVLVVTVPAVIFGASALSLMVLLASVVFGLPTVLAAFLFTQDRVWRSRLCRRVVLMGAVSAVSLAVVMQTDKLTPSMATPIAKAIEQYKNDTGNYPATLAELSPRYLVKLPAVRVAIVQPDISYLVRDNRPRLAIPSVAGDGFANYEYDFEAKAWVNNI